MNAPKAIKVSCREAAAFLGTTEKVLARWRLDRRGPVFFRPQVGRPFYLQSDLEDWLQAGRVQTFPETTQNYRKRPVSLGEPSYIASDEDAQ